MRNHPQRPIIPPLPALLPTPRIPNRINHPVHTPNRAQHRRRNGPPQSGNKQSAEDGGVVLAEVLVRALRRVEGEERLLRSWGGGLHLLVRGVLEGVGDLGRFAEGAHAAAVPGADEEGADGGAEDVASGGC